MRRFSATVHTMKLSIIAAAAENNVIGKGNDLPWDLPDDLQHFKEITEGSPVIMGLKTFESLGRPLPNRQNIVLSFEPDVPIEGCDVVGSLEDAIKLAEGGGAKESFIIGGGSVYAQAMPKADRIYLTRVHADVDGDIFFPEVDEEKWEEVSRERHEKDDQHQYAFSFLRFERRNNAM